MPVTIPNITIPICLLTSGLLFMASGLTFLLAALLARRTVAPARPANPDDEWVTGYAFPEYEEAESAARARCYAGGRWTWRAPVFGYHDGIAGTPVGYVVPCVYHPRKRRLNTNAYDLSPGARFWLQVLGWIGAPLWWHWDSNNHQPPEERNLAWRSSPTA